MPVGFEPTEGFPPHRFSKPAPSSSRPRHHVQFFVQFRIPEQAARRGIEPLPVTRPLVFKTSAQPLELYTPYMREAPVWCQKGLRNNRNCYQRTTKDTMTDWPRLLVVPCVTFMNQSSHTFYSLSSHGHGYCLNDRPCPRSPGGTRTHKPHGVGF